MLAPKMASNNQKIPLQFGQVWSNSFPVVNVRNWGAAASLLQALCCFWRCILPWTFFEGLVVKEGKAQAVVTEGRRIRCDQVVLPASLVPAELRLEGEGTGLGSCSRAVLLSKASMLPTEKEQLTFLSMPKNQDGSS